MSAYALASRKPENRQPCCGMPGRFPQAGRRARVVDSGIGRKLPTLGLSKTFKHICKVRGIDNLQAHLRCQLL